MALVECGRCGWTHEVDEELHNSDLEFEAARLYTEHTLEDHPAAARTDAVVQSFQTYHLSLIAPNNGYPFKLKRD